MSRGHTQATVSAIPLPEMAILSRWWAAGIVGPIAEARRTYLVMRSMASKMPDFDALFPAEADLTRGEDADLPPEAESNRRAFAWMENWKNENAG